MLCEDWSRPEPGERARRLKDKIQSRLEWTGKRGLHGWENGIETCGNAGCDRRAA